MTEPLRVALVHDWLTGMRGGEHVLEAIAEIFPHSDLFTLIYVPGKISPTLTTLPRHTSLLQKIPGIERRYRHFLPAMPQLIERFDLSGFDLVISSSHCVAKGIRKAPGAVHVSYVHAPMRYIWDRYDDYFSPGRSSKPVRLAARSVRKYLQNWDRGVSTPERIDKILVNSQFIGEQVSRLYGRESQVVYPFADLKRLGGAAGIPRIAGRNYLILSAFAPYKKIDLAIEAFNRLKLPLVVVGSGQDEVRLKKMAGPTIDFIGSVSNSAVIDFFSKCRAYVFPGIEDFGISPVEAMAAGAPVIAFGKGGVTETVTEKTGIFFRPQTVEALMEAVLKVESGGVRFDENDCRERAAQFSRERFQSEFVSAVREAWKTAGKDPERLNERLKSSWSSTVQKM